MSMSEADKDAARAREAEPEKTEEELRDRIKHLEGECERGRLRIANSEYSLRAMEALIQAYKQEPVEPIDPPLWALELAQRSIAPGSGFYASNLVAEARKIVDKARCSGGEQSEPEELYVVFDGPPSHESGRFIEVENANGEGRGPAQTGADWTEREDGLWTLGPFYAEA